MSQSNGSGRRGPKVWSPETKWDADQLAHRATTVVAQRRSLHLAVVRSRKNAGGLRRVNGQTQLSSTTPPHALTRRAALLGVIE